jgi:hypothetical protein
VDEQALAGSLRAMGLARPGWTVEDTARDLMVVLGGGESCEPVTAEETRVAELERHLDLDHQVLIRLGVLAADFKKVAADALHAHAAVNMDTDADRALHAQLVGSLTAALDAASERQRELTAEIRTANLAAKEHGG